MHVSCNRSYRRKLSFFAADATVPGHISMITRLERLLLCGTGPCTVVPGTILKFGWSLVVDGGKKKKCCGKKKMEERRRRRRRRRKKEKIEGKKKRREQESSRRRGRRVVIVIIYFIFIFIIIIANKLEEGLLYLSFLMKSFYIQKNKY